MKRALLLGALVALTLGAPAVAGAPPGAPSCPIFPANNVWHADISGLPVHARSAAWMANSNAGTTRLHPDFGPSGEAVPYGIPWIAVAGSYGRVTPTFDYDDESDKGPYPFDGATPIEGGAGSGGDQHALMVDRDACVLYELYDANWNGGRPTAGSGAIFDLKKNDLRPAGWTSADAAGLPILAGLLRLDEVQAGNVDHAIRFTVSRTHRSYLWPARHQAGSTDDLNFPPMGARFRLRGDFNMAGYRPDTQVVLRAMQHYGMILADNGSNWYFQGTAEDGWPDGFITDLKRVPASAFEAVDESSLMIDPNSAQYRGGVAAPSPVATTKPVAKPTATTAPKGVVSPAPVASTTTVPDTTTSVLGPLLGSDPGNGPQSGEVALKTPSSSDDNGRGLAPWLAGGLLLGAGGATGFAVWRRRHGAAVS